MTIQIYIKAGDSPNPQKLTPREFILMGPGNQQEVLQALSDLGRKCQNLYQLGVTASPMDPVSNIVRDTSEQRAVPGDACDMADLLFIIEWMYWSGGMVFGKDKEVDNAIARVKNSLTRSMGMREDRRMSIKRMHCIQARPCQCPRHPERHLRFYYDRIHYAWGVQVRCYYCPRIGPRRLTR